MHKKVLITGGKGFLGRNVAQLFNKKGYEITALGHGAWSFQDYKSYGISKWINANVEKNILIILKQEFEIIIHCAGGSSIEKSIENVKEDYRRTVVTTKNLLEYICNYNKNAVLIYPSSGAVYGEGHLGKIKEDDKLNPISPYGFHKKQAETICEFYSRNFGLKVNIIRFFSLYGNGLKKQLIWDACNKFYIQKQPVFHGSGQELRDWLHISDAVDLIHKVSQSHSNYSIINGGAGIGVKVRDIVDEISVYFNKKYLFNNIKYNGNPDSYIADISRANQIGWYPKKILKEELENYVKWFREIRKI